ncbi:MAG: SCO family protein [Pseudomonadota bacterium]|nr:SCO family protein [Pseudomonadota bacterium]
MKTHLRASLIFSSIGLCIVLGLLVGRTFTATDEILAKRQTADIGRTFELVDDAGLRVTQDNLKGHYSLIYFGFTYCPDVCPTSLQIMTLALETMEATNETVDIATAIRPIFITVDPERDTPAALKQYVSHFHPRLSGWTGTPAQIDDAMRAFKVYRARIGDASNPDGYTIDHSSIFYLMGPDGAFVSHFDHAVSPEDLAAALNKLIAG